MCRLVIKCSRIRCLSQNSRETHSSWSSLSLFEEGRQFTKLGCGVGPFSLSMDKPYQNRLFKGVVQERGVGRGMHLNCFMETEIQSKIVGQQSLHHSALVFGKSDQF